MELAAGGWTIGEELTFGGCMHTPAGSSSSSSLVWGPILSQSSGLRIDNTSQQTIHNALFNWTNLNYTMYIRRSLCLRLLI